LKKRGMNQGTSLYSKEVIKMDNDEQIRKEIEAEEEYERAEEEYVRNVREGELQQTINELEKCLKTIHDAQKEQSRLEASLRQRLLMR
jgi:hypothetical protein